MVCCILGSFCVMGMEMTKLCRVRIEGFPFLSFPEIEFIYFFLKISGFFSVPLAQRYFQYFSEVTGSTKFQSV